MTSDIILSSQLVKNDQQSSTILEYLSTLADDECFTLSLSDEESDWESTSISSSSQHSRINKSGFLSESSNNGKSEPAVSMLPEDTNPPCSYDLFEEKMIIDNDSNANTPNSFNSFPLSNDTVDICNNSSTIKCQTASSQDLASPGTFYSNPACEEIQLTGSGNFLLDEDWSSFSEAVSFVEKSTTYKLQDLVIQSENLILENLTACVITCYPVREIWCKSQKHWQTMGTLLLGDFNGKYIKLVLWGKQCQHALSQCSGNILYIDRLRVKSFSGELIFRLLPENTLITVCSAISLTKFGPRNDKTIEKQLKNSVDLNLNWFKTHHSALCNSPIKGILRLTSGEVHFRDIWALNCGEMVHVSVRIASIQALSGLKNTPCVACVYNEACPGIYVNLYLNGSARNWVSLFKKFSNHMWEIWYVACCLSSNSDRIELQTTVFSTAECNFDEVPTSLSCINKPISSISSYLQLISFIKSGNSSCVTLNQVSIQSISVESPTMQQTIDTDTLETIGTKQRFAEIINKNSTELLNFTLSCRFQCCDTPFSLRSSYEKILYIFDIPTLKTLSNQAANFLFQKINVILCSQFTLTVNLDIRRDEIGLLKNFCMNFKSVVHATHL